jgi:HlyD family secretion protein
MSESHPLEFIKKHKWKVIAAALLLAVVTALLEWAPWSIGHFQGYVEGEYVYVASPVGGRLDELCVQRGQQVAAGDKLFRLDLSPEREELAQDEARLLLAEQNLARGKASVDSGAMSRKDYDTYVSDQRSAEQAVVQGRWKIQQKTQNSIISGFVQDTLYVVGEYVPANKPIVCLLPPENIKVRFFADARQRGGIALNHRVKLKVYGAKQDYYGRVNYLSSNAEYTPPVIYSNDTRGDLTFMIEVRPDKEALPHLYPGQPVEVVLLEAGN